MGTYPVSAGGLSSDNYEITYVNGNYTITDSDTDLDGIGDSVDSDNDGVTDYTEVEDDTVPLDECSLVIEHQTEDISWWNNQDCDGDGILNFLDPDDDGDGLESALENPVEILSSIQKMN